MTNAIDAPPLNFQFTSVVQPRPSGSLVIDQVATESESNMLPLSMVYAGPGLVLVLVGCLLVPVSLVVHGARRQYLTDTLLITAGSSLLLLLIWFAFDGPFSGLRWHSLPIVLWGGAMAFWISLTAALPVLIVKYLTRPR